MYDFGTGRRRCSSTTREEHRLAVISPDGTHLAFIQGRERNCARSTLESKQSPSLAQGDFAAGFETARPVAWSPDSKWLAYLVEAARGRSPTWASSRPRPGDATPQPVSFLANLEHRFDRVVAGRHVPDLRHGTAHRETARSRASTWCRGRRSSARIVFEACSSRRRRNPRPRAPAGTCRRPPHPPHLRRTPPHRRTAVFDDIRQRLSLLPVGVDVPGPDDQPRRQAAVDHRGSAAGQTNLYTYSIDELSREPAVARQLTSTAGQQGQRRSSPPTARKCSISMAAGRR